MIVEQISKERHNTNIIELFLNQTSLKEEDQKVILKLGIVIRN